MRATFALLLLSGGLFHDCGKDHACKPGTLLVGVELDDASAAADRLTVMVTVDGAPGRTQEVSHLVGEEVDAVEITFPHGYRVGAQVFVTVIAKRGSAAVGQGSGSVQLAPKCSLLVVSVHAPVVPDLSVGAADLATTACTPSSCPAGQFCNNGSCVACNVNAHCGPGCSDCAPQVCVGSGGGFQCGCVDDQSCAPGTFCQASACVSCNLDTHCGASCSNCSAQVENRLCVGGICGCTGATAGCSSTSFCNSGSCVPCNTVSHCSNGTLCIDCASQASGHACSSPGSDSPCGCSSIADCSAGQSCISGVCQG